MIAFKDFPSYVMGRPSGLDKAVIDASEWLKRKGIKPLNVETLISSGGTMSVGAPDGGLRVWYEVTEQ